MFIEDHHPASTSTQPPALVLHRTERQFHPCLISGFDGLVSPKRQYLTVGEFLDQRVNGMHETSSAQLVELCPQRVVRGNRDHILRHARLKPAERVVIGDDRPTIHGIEP